MLRDHAGVHTFSATPSTAGSQIQSVPHTIDALLKTGLAVSVKAPPHDRPRTLAGTGAGAVGGGPGGGA